VLTSILGALLALGGGVLAGFGVYLTSLAVAARSRPNPSRAHEPSSRLAVIVPAHDEELLIGRCLTSIRKQSYPCDLYRVIVIADNCSDDTVNVAREAGAEVMVRDEPEDPGKGQTLRWAMDRVLAADPSVDAIVVMDADSIADGGMLAALEAELAEGYPVVQADYRLLEEVGSPRSEMIAAGFLLFHCVRFAGRGRLGMAANLVGNGMLFSRGILDAHPWDAFTGVEDLEYSIRLRLAGIRPRFTRAAVVYGPGSATRRGVTVQRARWEGGRFHAVRRWLGPLVVAAFAGRDLSLLDEAVDLATPPLGLLAIITAGGSAVTGVAVLIGAAPAWSFIPWLVALVATPAFVLIGLNAAGAPGMTSRVVLGAPRFLFWKVVTYAQLARGFDAARWDRADRAAPGSRRVEIAGVPVDVVDMSAALSRIRAAMRGPNVFQVSTINLDFVVRAQGDPDVRRIFRRSDLNLADGAPVVWLGRLLGAEMPARVAGADLVPALMGEAAAAGARVFLLGGEGGVANAAAARFVDLYPGVQIAGTYEPARASVEGMDNEEILARIAAAKPDVLLVALGNPKQERWIDMHRERLGVSVAIGVGCVFDLVAGRATRAPRWMQDSGLEWLYRLAREPRRLVGRYIKDAIWLLPIAASVCMRIVARELAETA
jgi:exopolysaccharide biosynthesis WecB/TagA/CpsF family protein